ncbi:hypothetical protein R1sor_017974 [Riccia sorocarpa]|uniref:Small ribosomal subunit protein eS4 central region domain-containing protein n=1 Tax=Riccia sorocarpa TaxID=122646 RepID=A0ABD3IB54_9MARC
MINLCSSASSWFKETFEEAQCPQALDAPQARGSFSPKPSPGPHKERECLPLVVILRNRLKYALTYREVVPIVMQRLIQIDGKVRTDKCYPAGFMEEAKYKLCKVREANFGNKGVPYISTNDGRTIRYPDPLIKRNDTVKIDIETRKVVKFIKFDVEVRVSSCLSLKRHESPQELPRLRLEDRVKTMPKWVG